MVNAQKLGPRALGIEIGILPTGKWNAITDVQGVLVGHKTLILGDSIRTGVTAILPHEGNIFQQKVPSAIYTGNGFGKLAGSTQVQELGTIETPILLTNTLSVPTAANALIRYMLALEGNEEVRSVNPVVGETNDGRLNDIRALSITEENVLEAINNARSGMVAEGNVGAGTGTVAFGFKGGIGTSSRRLPKDLGGYIVGVLVQANFGGVLQINGVPVGKKLGNYPYKKEIMEDTDGSCMMVVATDAPVSPKNLERIAKRAMLGLARTGGIASNGSGDYVIAFSTAEKNRIAYKATAGSLYKAEFLRNESLSPLFLATIEATEEAILNALFKAESMSGFNGTNVEALPVDQILPWLNEKD